MGGITLELSIVGRMLRFVPIDLIVSERGVTDVFARMNSQTVEGIIAKRRYARLAREVTGRYPDHLGDKVGQFLYMLKDRGDPFYRRFLNSYGDLTYCRFFIKDYLSSRGIYVYMRNTETVYVARSLDPFAKRINQGYGRIDPKHCYLDGQATNCHLNALIAEETESVSLHVLPMDDVHQIVEIERFLIIRERPRWNIALAGKDPLIT